MARSMPGFDPARWLFDMLDQARHLVLDDEPEVIPRAEHRQVVDRITHSFNRDAGAWIRERDRAEHKLTMIESLCRSEHVEQSELADAILRVIRGTL